MQEVITLDKEREELFNAIKNSNIIINNSDEFFKEQLNNLKDEELKLLQQILDYAKNNKVDAKVKLYLQTAGINLYITYNDNNLQQKRKQLIELFKEKCTKIDGLQYLEELVSEYGEYEINILTKLLEFLEKENLEFSLWTDEIEGDTIFYFRLKRKDGLEIDFNDIHSYYEYLQKLDKYRLLYYVSFVD